VAEKKRDDSKCARTGCENKAEYFPKLLLYAHRGTTPADAVLDLPLCNECMLQTRVNDLVTDEWWRNIKEVFRAKGKQPPRKFLTKVAAVRISEWRK
jgi:hypothetical protein